MTSSINFVTLFIRQKYERMVKLNVLILGASDNPERFSYKANELLYQLGHHVFLVAQKPKVFEGGQIQCEFPAKERIDVITLYLGANNQVNWYSSILNSIPKKVIFNPGTENRELQLKLSEKGIPWEEACTLVLLQTGQFP